MPGDSVATKSVWMHESVPEFPPLETDRRAEVCVIGGGIAGLTTAFLLQQAGRSVVLVEDGALGSGETGRSTAHISNALDDGYFELERLHGREGARLAAESHTAALDQIEALVLQAGIDCDFTRLDGYLFLAPGGSIDDLEDELGAALRAGLEDVRLLPRAPLPFFETGPCLQFPRQAQFHPLKYLAGLARALVDAGGAIHTRTHVASVEGGTPCRVTTDGGTVIRSDAVVVATNTPFNDKFAIHTKQAPYRTYVIGMRVSRGSVPAGLYWDTADPYHYVRLQPESESHDVLIVGGEDHRTGQAHDSERCFERLETWARERFPVTGASIVYRWSGQIVEPVDDLAFIGRNPNDAENVYIATGDSGHGITHGTIAGMLLRDLILGRANAWASLYDPSRKVARSATEYAWENIHVVRQYAEHLTPGEVKSPDTIRPGSGAILRHRVAKLAVYRDRAGVVHAYSAVCPHAGCIVHWNPTEGSWDCPCHGSRFDPYGHVINGPANMPLMPVHIEGVVPRSEAADRDRSRRNDRPRP